MKNIIVVNETRPLNAPLQAGYCVSYWCRLRGFSFRRKIPKDWGLLVVEPKESLYYSTIHMFGVFFDLGIVWINESGEVVDHCVAKRWISIKAPKRPAKYMLEIVPTRIEEFQIGDRIRFEQAPVN